MTTSVREGILAQMATLLAGTDGVTGSVYRSRPAALATQELPALLVEPINESSSYSTLNYLDWTLQVRVAVVLRGDAPDQLADPILVSLHSLLMTDRSLGNRANDISPVSVDYRFADGDQAIAVIESIYSVSYRTKQDDLTVGG